MDLIFYLRHCGWSVVTLFARNISLCLSPLMSAAFQWFGLGQVGVATMLEYLPPSVCTCVGVRMLRNKLHLIFLMLTVNRNQM